MLVRTNMATFARNAQLATLVGNGIDVCRISEDGGGDGDCEVCARWEGKLVSITGKTKEFPTLADAQAEGVFHPNCVHRVEYVTDDEIAKAKAEAKKITNKKTKTKNAEKTEDVTEEITTNPKRTRKSKVVDDSQFLEPIKDNSFKGEYKGNSSSRKARSSFLDVNNNEGVNAKDIFDNDVEYTNEDVKNIRELKSKIFGKSSRLIENHIEAIKPSFIKLMNKAVDVIFASSTKEGSYSKTLPNGERAIFLDTSTYDGKHPLTLTHEGSHLIWWYKHPSSKQTGDLIPKEKEIQKIAKKEAQAFLNTFTKEELEAMKFDNRSTNNDKGKEQDIKTCEIIGKKLGLTDEQIKEKQVQLSNIADTLLCATNGKYGFGHDNIYISSPKDCVNEVIAQTMNSNLTKDNLVGKIFRETQKQVIEE